jgi:hypothetical protein
MIFTLILAGLLGMLAPWLGFMVLFVGGMFLAGVTAGLLGIVIVILIVLVLAAVHS